jgi:hypothetical protein
MLGVFAGKQFPATVSRVTLLIEMSLKPPREIRERLPRDGTLRSRVRQELHSCNFL